MTATMTKPAKVTLTVVTPLGTFTRTTDRTYTHIVVSEVDAAHKGQGYLRADTVEWCGRLELAYAKASSNLGMRIASDADYRRAMGGKVRRPTGPLVYSSARIFEVATGTEVPR